MSDALLSKQMKLANRQSNQCKQSILTQHQSPNSLSLPNT